MKKLINKIKKILELKKVKKSCTTYDWWDDMPIPSIPSYRLILSHRLHVGYFTSSNAENIQRVKDIFNEMGIDFTYTEDRSEIILRMPYSIFKTAFTFRIHKLVSTLAIIRPVDTVIHIEVDVHGCIFTEVFTMDSVNLRSMYIYLSQLLDRFNLRVKAQDINYPMTPSECYIPSINPWRIGYDPYQENNKPIKRKNIPF